MVVQDIYIYETPYLIRTEMRLSMAIHYFAGEGPYDIMINHGVSLRMPVFV
jgi:hypothetical protein